MRDYINREVRKGNLVRIKNKSAISSESQADNAIDFADNASEDIKSSSDDSVNTQEQYQASEAWDDGELFNNRALVSEETIDKWLTGGWFGSNTNENYAQAYIAYLTPSLERYSKNGVSFNEIEKIIWKDNKVYLSKSFYISGISISLWNYYVGGYQPLQRWLKDRKGQILIENDIIHYKKIANAIIKTDEIIKEIDRLEIDC